jgi:hypothetical protein
MSRTVGLPWRFPIFSIFRRDLPFTPSSHKCELEPSTRTSADSVEAQRDIQMDEGLLSFRVTMYLVLTNFSLSSLDSVAVLTFTLII